MVEYNGYGAVAIKAAVAARNGEGPREAWKMAAAEGFGLDSSSAKKGCPKSAFLGLCSSGRISGVRAGEYTRSIDNRCYAEDAAKLVLSNPAHAENKKALWQKVTCGLSITENSQMDVVVALWNQGFLSAHSE